MSNYIIFKRHSKFYQFEHWLSLYIFSLHFLKIQPFLTKLKTRPLTLRVSWLALIFFFLQVLSWTSPLISLWALKEQERPTWTATSVARPKLRPSKTLKSSTITTIHTQWNTRLCSRYGGKSTSIYEHAEAHCDMHVLWLELNLRTYKMWSYLCFQGPIGVAVTYGGDHIPKSPFNVGVAPTLDLSKISVTGLGDSMHFYFCILHLWLQSFWM